MKLHDYAASGNCYKARLLLALLGREYERVPVDIFAGDTLTPDLERLNPVRETPVLELDDGETVTQSSAILWYLAQGTPFLPGDPRGQAHVVEWLSFEQERIMVGVGGTRFRRLTGRALLDPAADAARFAAGVHALELLDARLEGRSFVVGASCSIADIALYAYTHVAEEGRFELARFPAIGRWLERVRNQPKHIPITQG
jgi:glutathione S-transferase